LKVQLLFLGLLSRLRATAWSQQERLTRAPRLATCGQPCPQKSLRNLLDKKPEQCSQKTNKTKKPKKIATKNLSVLTFPEAFSNLTGFSFFPGVVPWKGGKRTLARFSGLLHNVTADCFKAVGDVG
jgi:hypothetical protein